MGLWQRAMIALARNEPLTMFMHRRSALSALARRFVGGDNLAEAIQTAADLRQRGRLCSLFYLGEYVDDPATVARTMNELKAAVYELARARLDVHVSVDPTAVGLMIDEATCRANVFELGRAVAATGGATDVQRRYLMLDMEDSSATDATIGLYADLRAASLPAAITLQAYLHRYEADVRRCVTPGGAVRLVKGALGEPPRLASTRRPEIGRRYLRAAGLMLAPEAREAGFYPIFATHDVRLIREIRAAARRNGWPAGGYEFEMLYGVRPPLQDALVERGERLRLYLPFGSSWWPYAIRRVGETPRNAGLLLRAVLASA
ncbi:MAG: proline dehydrogenase family protein [Chloroflexi bacterium]|nr:proline dehydrogenase family protein [Chloroflexota bacterium]